MRYIGNRRGGSVTKGFFVILCIAVFLAAILAAIYAKKEKIMEAEKPVYELPEKKTTEEKINEIKEDFAAGLKPEVPIVTILKSEYETVSRKRNYWKKVAGELKKYLQQKNEDLLAQLNENFSLEEKANFYEKEYLNTRTTHNESIETSCERTQKLIGKINNLNKKLNISDAEKKAYKSDVKNLFAYWDALIKETEPDEVKKTNLIIAESKKKIERYTQAYKNTTFGNKSEQKSYENKKLLENEERKLAMEEEFLDDVLREKYNTYFTMKNSFEKLKQNFQEILE